MEINLRKFENYHIVLWLVKDLCWALVWKPLGIIMIVPTVGLAFYIAWRSLADRFEFLHNVAICFWICANAIWMVGEFYDKEWRYISVILFVCGISLIGAGYLWRWQDKKQNAPQNL